MSVSVCECVCVCVCVCVRACVYVKCPIFKRLNRKKETEQIYERPLLSPLQDRDLEDAVLYEIAVNGLRTRVGNVFIDAFAHRDMQIDTGTHADTDT